MTRRKALRLRREQGRLRRLRRQRPERVRMVDADEWRAVSMTRLRGPERRRALRRGARLLATVQGYVSMWQAADSAWSAIAAASGGAR